MIETYTRTSMIGAQSVIHVSKLKRIFNQPRRPGDFVTLANSGGFGTLIATVNDTVTVLWSDFPDVIHEYNPLAMDEDIYIPVRRSKTP